MSQETAERWVTISAVIVAGVYAYRRLTEAASTPVTLKKLLGVGGLPPLGSFATAWGFTYLILAVMTEAAPAFGGAFAILIATSDLLTNTTSVIADVDKQEGSSSTSSTNPGGATTADIAGEAPTTGALATAGEVHGAGTITPSVTVTH